jgi:hypothetical protein
MPLYFIEKWEQQKGRQPYSMNQILSSACDASAHGNILHHDLIIPDTSQSQLKLLRILLRLFIEALLTNHCKIPIVQTETKKFWGTLPKYTLPVTLAYTDCSASENEDKAGFWGIFPRNR